MGDIVRITFQGGTHGNFLRYFLDAYSTDTPTIQGDPFTETGTSHKDLKYSGKFIFDHPNDVPPYLNDRDNIDIMITVEKEDVLFLERIVHTRAGDLNMRMDDNVFEFTDDYIRIFELQNDKFKNLYGKTISNKIKIPRFIMRDYFKIMFLDIKNNGFVKKDKLYRKELTSKTYQFPVSCFWDNDLFFKEIKNLSESLKLNIMINDEAKKDYDNFISKIKEFDTKYRANEIINAIKEKKEFDCSVLDVIEEAYVSAFIESSNDFVTVPNTDKFFKNTLEINQWLDWYPQHYKAMNPNLPVFKNKPNPFYLHKNKK
jgi:hypothetical protein